MSIKAYTETRDWYGEALVNLAQEDSNVFALDCDLGRSTRSYRITEVDPSRFIEMGISEQDMISTAAGLSRMGKIPFANSFAIFITGRAFDQIRQQVALPKSNVKVCGSSAGLTQGPDGATHQSLLDIAIMRSLPNMTVFSPADGTQTLWAVRAAYELYGPAYIRLSRFKIHPIFQEDEKFSIGKVTTLRKGKDIALLTHGPITKNVISAADILKKEGFDPGIYNFPTIKPIDTDMIKDIASEYSCLVSIEEHSIIGGLGSAVAEVLAGILHNSSYLVRLGVNDVFGESGTAEELLKKHKLDPEGIAGSVLRIVRKESRGVKGTST